MPLFTAWRARNRRTASGREPCEYERIDIETALRTIVLGAAYTLKLDGEIGSIEVGNWADFAILDDDPVEADAEAIKDVSLWGTVIGG